MKRSELISEIAKQGLTEDEKVDYYRVHLVLPKKMLGRGKKYEMYTRIVSDTKPWKNGDCKIPVDNVEGAVVIGTNGDYATIDFIITLERLRPFVEELWKELKNFNYDVMVKMNNADAVGDET